jgi:DNA (cytosine-5)-methyltransferase 1
VPQHRERIIIIGFKKPKPFDFDAIKIPEKNKITISQILHKTDGTEPYLEWDAEKYFDHKKKKVLEKYTLTNGLWTYLQNYAAKHKAAGNGFGFGLAFPSSVARTLSARYYKDGSEILIYQGKNKNPRRLTPRECARLMGFPDSYKIPVSDTRAYKQFGNSVVVDVMKHAAKLMVKHLK